MSDEVLGDRRKALEEAFFAKQNAQLLERMKTEKEALAAKEALAKISGIESDEVLDKLCGLGIEADAWAAVLLVPLVEVAWADGRVEDSERQAVLSAAEANGIDVESPSRALLENWLDQRQGDRLFEVWQAFISGLCAALEPAERDTLKTQVIGRARDVAEAAGGFLGFGNKTSAVEEAVLTKLSNAFEV
jgi:hypothetical protein